MCFHFHSLLASEMGVQVTAIEMSPVMVKILLSVIRHYSKPIEVKGRKSTEINVKRGDELKRFEK